MNVPFEICSCVRVRRLLLFAATNVPGECELCPLGTRWGLAVGGVGVGVGEAAEGLLVHGAEYVRLHGREARPLARERAVEVLRVERVPLQPQSYPSAKVGT